MPERRCAGCGLKAPKPDLVRLALAPAPSFTAGADGRSPGVLPTGAPPGAGARGQRGEPGSRPLVVDARGVLPGRGGYLCRGDHPGVPSSACLERALRRGGLNRAFRAAVTIPANFVESIC